MKRLFTSERLICFGAIFLLFACTEPASDSGENRDTDDQLQDGGIPHKDTDDQLQDGGIPPIDTDDQLQDGGIPHIDAVCPPENVEREVGEDFTVIVLPDTQNYTKWKNSFFQAQIEWIVNNQDALNIVMVLHEGDIVQSYDTVVGEWEFADQMMSMLDSAGIPFVLVPGNHDYAQNSRDSTVFNQYFPLSRFEAMATFGGAFEEEKSDNTYHLLSAGGIDFLILGLEFGPREGVLDWARSVASESITHVALVLTHAYLSEEEFLLTRTTPHNPTVGYGLDEDANSGVDIWKKLIAPMGNIRFVFSGHVGSASDGAAYLESAGECGELVHQMMANYQYQSWDESGYLRILSFFPSQDKLSVTTYAPADDRYGDGENSFEINGLGIW